jgi:hypothetical protein
MFNVGQRIICIKTSKFTHPSWALVPNRVTVGALYTVRAIGALRYKRNLEPAVWLEEVFNPVISWTDRVCEYGFHAGWFRPTQERKTDISIFTKLLTPKKEDA